MIQLKQIEKIYQKAKPNEVTALKGVSLTIHDGDLIAITGPSGSGKTTLLHILACLEKPDAGEYILNGQNVAELSERKKADLRNSYFGIVLQDFGLMEEESVLLNVCLPLLIGKMRHKEAKKAAVSALEHMGIPSLATKKVNQLSGGQKQRVAIARALVHKPQIILADEPTGALDSAHTEELLQLIRKCNEEGITFLIVTHNPVVADFCTRQMHIIDGKLSE